MTFFGPSMTEKTVLEEMEELASELICKLEKIFHYKKKTLRDILGRTNFFLFSCVQTIMLLLYLCFYVLISACAK